MELTNLAKGTSIYQRYTLLERYHADKQTTLASRQDLANYNRWRARPTTITDERFDELLQSQQLTKEAFDLAVKELTDEEMNYIYQEIGEDGWVKETKNIFSQQDSQANDTEGEYLNFTYALRLHIQYFEEKLKEIIQQFPNLSVDIEAAKEFVGAVINQLMDIGLRTFVYDLHVEKEKMNGIEAIDEKEGFKEYLIYRFDTKEKIKGFFVQYPVLTRLYAEIIGFQLVNFTELLSALSESEEVLNEQFAIDKPIKLTGLKLGAGDSHDKGKSVAILTVDQGIELVYKPKNLEIGHRFDQFMKEIKKMNPAFDFYLTKKIIGDTYTFEERLVYSECLSEEEVAEYYRQFGQTIALVYLLNGNDFHLENVLSFGKYPVLIDLETIIQNHFPMPSAQNALMKVIKENSESVVMSGLVPVYLFEERSESDVEGAEKGIQLSALSGGEQKLHYKILKLVNFDSIHMQFQYEEHTMDASENIPMFRGEKVDFVPYIETIIAGFQEFSRFAIENREHLAILAEDIFSNCFVRNVIKTTQSYGDLLDYSTHPTCMVDYIEREKLFENLWSHGYSNAKPVPYEVRDMLQHDVPIFFNPTSGYDLVASQGERIRGMYEKRAIDREISKLKFYSEQEEKEQLDYLRTSFGLYHPSHLQTKEIPTVFSEEEDLLLTGAKAIGQAIFAESFIGEESIAWKDIKEPSIDNYVVGVMDENFYDGISGMYLYFSELYHVTHEEPFKEAYRLAESLIIELDEDYVESSSAFYGSLAAVYPLLYNYLQTKEEKLLTTAVSIATKYMTSYAASAVQVYDWAGGTASVVHVFMLLYQVTQQERYLSFAKQVLADIDVDKIGQSGFAHGYSGVLYAANSVYKVEKDAAIESLICLCLKKERETFDVEQRAWLDLRITPPIVNDLWCYGSTGIGLAYLDLYESGFEDVQLAEEIGIAADRLLNQEKLNDCLCHGNLGDLAFLLAYNDSSLATKQQKQNVQAKIEQLQEKVMRQTYAFEGLPTIPKYGLFTGLAGIGHQLLRMSNPEKVVNVLTLTLPVT